MKKLIALAFATVAFVIFCSNTKKDEFSSEALSYKMMTSEGTEMTFKEILKKHKGKTIVIEVWASWCGDCVKNMPKIKELQANNPNLAYVFLSVDKTPEAWKNGIAKHEIKGEHYLISDGMKGSFGKAIELNWIPRYMIVDKKGKIALFKAIETDFETINATIKSTL
ncbi:TlpA family protein disulfide reductase [Flavobacterium sp.]|uniref:TlpA family protein disulfide reductase n=1 Tax=Flavobacterium sp. TaxID=239 RepID=UPI002639AE28|nr:TlpA family protein disulfide reductase [Flavobacterium sp.]